MISLFEMKGLLKKHLTNFGGKAVNRKLIVFESDDWGSIRIEGRRVQQELTNAGVVPDKDPFSLYDCLETSDDYRALTDILTSHVDHTGNHPVFTANFIMANPDFGKIEKDDFRKFHVKSFQDSYLDYNQDRDALDLLSQGIEKRVIFPQYHGREHLNAVRWLKKLQANDAAARRAFDLRCFAIASPSDNRRANLMASYDHQSEEELLFSIASVSDGLQRFKETFGYNSLTTIAPCYVWDQNMEQVFLQNNVKAFQGTRYQLVPITGSKNFQKKIHYTGTRNGEGQIYLIRNVLFEPALDANIDWIGRCLQSIAIAFFWNRPAVIGTHRINFAGGLESQNRDKNLLLLDSLLKKIIQKWPDVEFVNSAEIASMYLAA